MPDLSPSLRVLGVPALHGPDGEPITFRTRKHFALLIYLALEPQVHRREKVAALLWPSGTTAEARHSLATGLSVLRARLGRERVETDRDTVRLVPGSVELDLDRLARGEIHATETAPALAVAPLLQEFEVADAGPWDHWRDGAAARWQPAIRDALLTLIDRSRRQGNTRTMEVLADAMLRLDDLSEDGVRAKMESRAFAGDRLTALQIYEDWRVRLADELGAQPSELVAGMALRLRRRGWERESGEHIAAVRTDQWKDRPFVGRGTEYQTLYEGWEGCQRGASHHVLLTGESGVGKSTLVERLTTAAGLQGAASSRVQCHAVEREIPFGAIGGLATLLLDRPGASAIAPEWLSELSRTVSGVRKRFPSVVPPPEATGEMVRVRLADALHELVRTIAEEQPLILVMDDIHLGDDASVAVMHLLLRRLTDERVLVLCTLRQGEEALAPSARGMLERAEMAQMSVVPLPPLTEGESIELLGHLVPDEVDPPPSTVRRALLRAAAGLPMLLELLVRDWMSHGNRCVALAVDAMTEEPGTAGGAGETYKRLLERLSQGLDPTTRSVLNLAAILGSQLNDFELYSLVDLTMAQAMSGLSHLASLRILRDGGQGLEFVNEVMRGEVYFTVPSSVRKVLHSKVADRLIERRRGGEEMLGLAIAWHCIRSKRVQEAGEWLILGGKEAIERSALAEAEAALESGYRNLPLDSRVDSGTLLARVFLDQGRHQEAHHFLKTLGPTASLSPTCELVELARLTSLAVAISDQRTQDVTLQALLEIVRTGRDVDNRLRAATLAARLASYSMREDHHSQILEALPDKPSHDVSTLQARFYLIRAQVLYGLRRLSEAETILAHLGTLQDLDGPSLHRYNLHLGLGACLAARGDYEAAAHKAQVATSLAARAGSPVKEKSALANYSISCFRVGRFEEALRAATKARKITSAEDSSLISSSAFGVELCSMAVLDQTERFQEVLSKARDFAAAGINPPIAAATRFWIADALWISEDGAQAIAEALIGLNLTAEPTLACPGSAARWAAVVHLRYPSAELERIMLDALKVVDSADVLDQFEISISCIAALPPDKSANLPELHTIAMEAAGRLPHSAVALTARLGLPVRQVTGLSQHPHPST